MKVSDLCTIMGYSFTQAIDTVKFADSRGHVVHVTILIDDAYLLDTKDSIDDSRYFTDALKRIVKYAHNCNEDERARGIRYKEDVIRIVLLCPNESKYAHTLVSSAGLSEIGSGHVEDAHKSGKLHLSLLRICQTWTRLARLADPIDDPEVR
jgi:hypothetical protein